MNFGKIIFDLRKKKNVTQDELAAELGVTAAAVSKWENGYTLPDILMLCALADYFGVTTDELLGRNTAFEYAVIATDSEELGESIKKLAKSYGFITKQIYHNIMDAREAASHDPTISHIFASFSKPLTEEEHGDTPKGLRCIETHSDNYPDGILSGFEMYFQNITAFDSFRQKCNK